jgi:hypothetical protein
MRSFFFTLTLILFGHWNCQSQTVFDTDGLNNQDNVFLFSLKQYCNRLDSLKTNVVYVRSDHFIGDSWPTKIKSFEIKYLYTQKDYKVAIKENGGRVTIVGICPFNFRNGLFSTGVIPFSATYSKGMTHLSNGGGLTVYFEYDIEKKGMIYKSEKWSGI